MRHAVHGKGVEPDLFFHFEGPDAAVRKGAPLCKGDNGILSKPHQARLYLDAGAAPRKRKIHASYSV
jgi:hypothetical protein